ncbi:uncharacterized protein L3040_007219 [Drepanopeziza brunnea f. sp. 'multigermtubi']|uniref:Uncharacterized protein n=1 Tax=Marssonina brunnea f. sp. multigermtubi (strain MB_m1) TaxID=1072389 RepID=K1WL62_MARBU|nr:uncharacterized protein MBM_08294 [Drepanopeziza brunnea f. sp. 'multigermtubi' MB_m1]EKD13576.1 hypothetical protein MBM_08294 [Drepanopeziza brunnea f. sp. 'multigermtubi' MB_m1]KAJ5038354.1 hypothetical protein L3040_007219 [Drepanopeziza brunnea f. sp. 'multigermtubi']
MMFTNTIVAAAALAASVVTAAPAPGKVIQPTSTIKLCNDFNWNQCREMQYTPQVCTEIPNDFHDVVSSLNTYNKQCTFFVDRYCPRQSGSFYWNGVVQNIRDHPDLGNYENKISSFKCES